MNEETAVTARGSLTHGAALPVLGAVLTIAGWAVMWGLVTFFNLFGFWALWTGAALLMWWASADGYPGIRRHAALAAISVPLWWWFELVDTRTRNWDYVNPFEPGPFWYVVLGSVAFSTVVPAIVAATALVRRVAPGAAAQTTGGAVRTGRAAQTPEGVAQAPPGMAQAPGTRSVGETAMRPGLAAGSPRAAAAQIVAGLLLQVLVFVFPAALYPLVWVAPFLIVDGAGMALENRSLLAGMAAGRWREASIIAGAGLLCGVLWEFWNYWSVPSWEYSVPLLGFWKVFEMPLLGYLGYIPFAWTIVRLVDVLDRLWRGPGG